MSKKKKVLFLGSVPMSLTELQMAPAMIGAFVRKRGHDFSYRDINLDLFSGCGCDYSLYIDQTEFLQNKDSLGQSNEIIDAWQHSVIDRFDGVDILLINVFSVFSQVPALRLIALARQHALGIKIIMGGIGSHKKLLGGINEFNQGWAQDYFPRLDSDIFGQVCLDNGLVDDWQPTVAMDRLESWLPQRPMVNYHREFDFNDYRIDHYQWGTGGRRIPMLGSHGCVRQCSFCDVIKHFPRYSFIEADALTKSIVEAYEQTGVHRVQFMDSLVNGSMKNFLQLLKNLSQAREQGWLPQDFSWSGTYICRPPSNQLDEIHQYLAPSGADNLVIGVETGSDRVRYEMEKKFKNADLLDEMRAFRQHGIKASGLFFPSWPTETQADFQETLGLFDALAEYGQSGTLEGVQLGTTGFTLIDGTPIDRDKEKIGLVQGPLPWLWRCETNPSLTFWETLRRRLLMAEWCEMRGIRVDQENSYRRYLSFNLEQHRPIIQGYSGDLAAMIDVRQYLPSKIQHSLRMKVVNSGDRSARLRISTGHQQQEYVCGPGVCAVEFVFDREMAMAQELRLEFLFDQSHEIQWDTYDSGDYYDRRGLYLDDIWVDHSDITYWGWNHLVDQTWSSPVALPDDYLQHRNLRCVTAGMVLSVHMPQYQSLHKYLTDRRQPELAAERAAVTGRLESALGKFLA